MRFAFLLLASCATTGDIRRPDTAAITPRVDPLPYVAHADVAGVLMWANTHLWREAPADLESWATVVGVDLQNAGDQPIAFRLEDVRLVNDRGEEAAPFFAPRFTTWPVNREVLEEGLARFPPFTEDVESVITRGLGNGTTVFIGEELRRSGSSSGEWTELYGIGRLPFDWTSEVRFVRVPHALQTRAIFSRTIAPGESASGYLIFPRVTHAMRDVTLVWRPQGLDDEGRIEFDVGSPSMAL